MKIKTGDLSTTARGPLKAGDGKLSNREAFKLVNYHHYVSSGRRITAPRRVFQFLGSQAKDSSKGDASLSTSTTNKFPFRTILSSKLPLAIQERGSCELSSSKGVKSVDLGAAAANSSRQFNRRLQQISSQVHRLKQIQQDVFAAKSQTNLSQNAKSIETSPRSSSHNKRLEIVFTPDEQSTQVGRQLSTQSGRPRSTQVSWLDQQSSSHSESKLTEPVASDDQLFKLPALPRDKQTLKTPQTVKQMKPASNQLQTSVQRLPSDQANQDQITPSSSEHQRRIKQSVSTQSGKQDQEPKQIQQTPTLDQQSKQRQILPNFSKAISMISSSGINNNVLSTSEVSTSKNSLAQECVSEKELHQQVEGSVLQSSSGSIKQAQSIMIESNHELSTFGTNYELGTDSNGSKKNDDKQALVTPMATINHPAESKIIVSSHQQQPEIDISNTTRRKARVRSSLRKKKKKPKYDVYESLKIEPTCTTEQSVGGDELLSTGNENREADEPPQFYYKLVYDETSNKWTRHEIITDYKHLDEEKSKVRMQKPARSWSKGPHKVKGRKTDMLKTLLPTALITTNVNHRFKSEPKLAQRLDVTDPLRIELHKRKMPIVPGHYQEHIYKFGKLPFRNNPR